MDIDIIIKEVIYLKNGLQDISLFKITCPCCLQEIISPRGELQKLISDNANQIQIYKDELTKIKEMMKTASPKQQEMLMNKREVIVNKLVPLNEKSNIYKKKRQILAEHETVSAYNILKEVIVERYGDRAYIECMQEVAKRAETHILDNDTKIIEII